MVTPESLWKDNLQRLGEFIKAQRQLNQLSQRELARLSDLSDTYMSQLERGLHEPSIRVLRALAESLGIQPNELINYAAGLPVAGADEPSTVRTEDAIRSLVISQRLLGTDEILLIHHTDCGMLTFKDDAVKDQIEADTGIRPSFALEAFPGLEADVRQTAARIQASPFVPRKNIRGFVYDVHTGRLDEVQL